MTTRNAIVTLLSHLAIRPEVLNKIRSELKIKVGLAGKTDE